MGDVCEQQHALNMLIKVLVDMEQELPQDLLANPLLKDVHGTEELASFGDIGFGQILCVAKDSSTRRQGLGLKLAEYHVQTAGRAGVSDSALARAPQRRRRVWPLTRLEGHLCAR